MSSRGGTFSVFHHVNSSSCEQSKSFSIRSILNLPEESRENRVPSSSNSSPAESCCSVQPRFPLVPRAVRPIVHHHIDNVQPSSLINWQDFRFTPSAYTWGYGTLPFKDQGFLLGIFPKKKRRPMRKKKQRPLFSPHQIQTMEKEFAKQRYVTEDRRARLASEVNLTETQVKTWFQNRRTKWKKEIKDEANATTRRSLGEMEHVSFATHGNNPFNQNICVDSLVNPFRALPPYCNAPMFSTFNFKGSYIA